jgi:hypothetical protein
MKTGRFFTEGTNLFNIGNIFYSRRIGAPSTYPNVAANEEVTNYTQFCRFNQCRKSIKN